MITFVSSKDPTWAKDNLETTLDTYKANAVWVYDPNFKSVYHFNNLEEAAWTEVPVDPNTLRSASVKSKFTHFFVPTGQGLLEVRGAPIQPSKDAKRITAPRGWLFCGQVWDGDYLKGLSTLIGGSVKVLDLPAPPFTSRRRAEIAFTSDLAGIDDRPVKRLGVRLVSETMSALEANSRQSFFQLAVFAAVTFLVIALSLFVWVTRPLGLLSAALIEESPRGLERLEQKPNEFGRLAKLIQAWKIAEEASKSKSVFIANISHEFRTPLNGVIGFAQLLKGTRLDERQTRWVDTIMQSGRFLLSLINQIIDLSRIEAGKMAVESSVFSPRDLVTGAVGMIGPIAAKKRLPVRVEVEDSVPAALKADDKKLAQIVVNLLGNAVKFTSAGHVEVRLAMADGRLQLSVIDTGPGIPKDKQDRLFRAFEQLEYGLNRTHEGSGLGLDITAKLVRIMGGEIEVISDAGQGSTFIVRVPVEAVDQSEVPAPADEAGQAAALDLVLTSPIPGAVTDSPAARLVLVAEDNPINREMVREMLEASGFKVAEAENGQICLDMMRQFKPDLMLMDLAMPVMDGLTAARAVRQDGEFQGMPMVALTASAMLGDREKCLAAGFDNYLAKPFLCEDLIRVINRVMAGRVGGHA